MTDYELNSVTITGELHIFTSLGMYWLQCSGVKTDCPKSLDNINTATVVRWNPRRLKSNCLPLLLLQLESVGFRVVPFET